MVYGIADVKKEGCDKFYNPIVQCPCVEKTNYLQQVHRMMQLKKLGANMPHKFIKKKIIFLSQ
jgi:hypothetical protein